MQKNNINDYKDRLGSPFGAVKVNPKTGKPIKQKKKGK